MENPATPPPEEGAVRYADGRTWTYLNGRWVDHRDRLEIFKAHGDEGQPEDLAELHAHEMHLGFGFDGTFHVTDRNGICAGTYVTIRQATIVLAHYGWDAYATGRCPTCQHTPEITDSGLRTARR